MSPHSAEAIRAREVLEATVAGAAVAGHTSTTTAVEPTVPRTLVIALIEDDDDNRNLLQTLLELDGHKVAAKADGSGGLHLILELLPDVALIDLGLPILDGFQVARLARANPTCARVVLIALTGQGTRADVARAHHCGFDAHLHKPIQMSELTRILRDIAELKISNHKPLK